MVSRTYTFTFLPQAKKVSELLKEVCGSGVFKVTHYNQFVKDSDRAEDLELCRVILQGLSMFQHLSTAWPGHTSGKALGHHWEEDLSVWWIETQDLNIFFSNNRGRDLREKMWKQRGKTQSCCVCKQEPVFPQKQTDPSAHQLLLFGFNLNLM